jgi:hypothetical protein
MSRSNTTTTTSSNPSKRYLEWGGESGILSYWDKEQAKSITVEPPFTFMVLDELSSVTGYDGKNKCGIYSNEVKETKTSVLTVKSFKGGEIAKGIYSEIKDKVNALGYKYTKSIYIAFKDGKELTIANIKFKGAALNAWIDFASDNKDAIKNKSIILTGKLEQKTGRVDFFTPIFDVKDITPQTNTQAIELDKELQAYFKEYFNKTDTSTTPENNNGVEALKNAFGLELNDDSPF